MSLINTSTDPCVMVADTLTVGDLHLKHTMNNSNSCSTFYLHGLNILGSLTGALLCVLSNSNVSIRNHNNLLLKCMMTQIETSRFFASSSACMPRRPSASKGTPATHNASGKSSGGGAKIRKVGRQNVKYVDVNLCLKCYKTHLVPTFFRE